MGRKMSAARDFAAGETFTQDCDWNIREREQRRNRNLHRPFGGAGFRIADFRCCGRSKAVQERPEITSISIASAAEKSSFARSEPQFFTADDDQVLVHVERRHDLRERRWRLTSKSGAQALDRTRSGVNSEAVEQVLEPCRIATRQHGEAFQAEQCQHFVNGGVAGGDASSGVIVRLQYGEVVSCGCDLRRAHGRALFGGFDGGRAALRHEPDCITS